MGTRGEIVLHYGEGHDIVLYQHWDSYLLPGQLRDALAHGRSRWNDKPYLARIIFSQIIGPDNWNACTGYGLAPYRMESNIPDIDVDLPANIVTVGAHRFGFADYVTLTNEQANALIDEGEDDDDV